MINLFLFLKIIILLNSKKINEIKLLYKYIFLNWNNGVEKVIENLINLIEKISWEYN